MHTLVSWVHFLFTHAASAFLFFFFFMFIKSRAVTCDQIFKPTHGPHTHPDCWSACHSSSDLLIRAQRLCAAGWDHSTVHHGPGLCRRSLLFGYLQPRVTAAASGMIITVGWSGVRGFMQHNSGWGNCRPHYLQSYPDLLRPICSVHLHSFSQHIWNQLVDVLTIFNWHCKLVIEVSSSLF